MFDINKNYTQYYNIMPFCSLRNPLLFNNKFHSHLKKIQPFFLIAKKTRSIIERVLTFKPIVYIFSLLCLTNFNAGTNFQVST